LDPNHLSQHLIAVLSLALREAEHLDLRELVKSVKTLGRLASASLFPEAVTERDVLGWQCLLL
jgi:hypothetical protein